MTSKKFRKENEHSTDNFSARILPKVKPDTEENTAKDLIDDFKEESDHPYSKYPPPKQNKIFRTKWRDFISNLADRKDFQEHLLSQLEILCDLYVEYEELSKFLRTHGYTYEAYGRQGKIFRTFPQVSQLNKVKADIKIYSKSLGLTTSGRAEVSAGKESGDWE